MTIWQALLYEREKYENLLADETLLLNGQLKRKLSLIGFALDDIIAQHELSADKLYEWHMIQLTSAIDQLMRDIMNTQTTTKGNREL
jgi:hypothetical protein